jgi:O-antigen/teichoic acid export membrane protein
LLVGANKVNKVFKYSLIAAVAQLLLVPIFVIYLNGLGLTLLMFIVIPLLTDLLYVRSLTKTFKIKIEFMALWKIVGCSIFSALFILPLIFVLNSNTIPLLITAVVEQLIIYPIIVGFFGGIDKERLDMLARVAKGLPVVGIAMNLLTEYTSIFLR